MSLVDCAGRELRANQPIKCFGDPDEADIIV